MRTEGMLGARGAEKSNQLRRQVNLSWKEGEESSVELGRTGLEMGKR
jgi:hypothetical protein